MMICIDKWPIILQSEVFAARVATERGDVLRVFAFDRFNETAFSVDMIILNGTNCNINARCFWIFLLQECGIAHEK